MFRTLDVVLIAVMTAAATVTYSLKHQAENKQEEVRKLDAEIKLEEDTIDLLKADWALLTQPSRLNRLVKTFEGDLKLVPTESTQLVQPNELPMPMAELPALEPAKDAKADAKVADGKKNTKKKNTDAIQTGSVAN
ncbi:hypothetical protein [Shinella sp. WSJ-2]|uniref:cell division protein FtsL n=1 Tax=Shinella sp. WSJ-2 TaxID=2303749 RepID=UPI001FE1704C|nr:hypothetical protein [Shinella sp. WSJ-2]